MPPRAPASTCFRVTNAVAEAGSGYFTLDEIYFYSDTACTQQIDVSSGTFTHGRVDGVYADSSSYYNHNLLVIVCSGWIS